MLGLAADHDQDGDGDEAEGDPDTDESTEDGSDDELVSDWTGVNVDSALGVLGGEGAAGREVECGDCHTCRGSHQGSWP